MENNQNQNPYQYQNNPMMNGMMPPSMGGGIGGGYNQMQGQMGMGMRQGQMGMGQGQMGMRGGGYFPNMQQQQPPFFG